jgi:hypothetical protein
MFEKNSTFDFQEYKKTIHNPPPPLDQLEMWEEITQTLKMHS